jgi:ribonuclease BN (tRNA processing enzyme)
MNNDKTVQVRILGCSGGIGGHLRTTAMLVDDDILIDAGTGVADLSIEAMMAIDHIFVTHSHLDHIACIPLLVDTLIGRREQPITVYATQETWQILKDHIFNWKIWPDFTVIPNTAFPFLEHQEIRLGETVVLGERQITPLPARHTVPAVGFRIDSGRASLVFSGDTSPCDALWAVVNGMDNLRYLIVETAFSNHEFALAELSQHLYPASLLTELKKLTVRPEIYITHLKPGEEEAIMQQIAQEAGMGAKALRHGQLFTL